MKRINIIKIHMGTFREDLNLIIFKYANLTLQEMQKLNSTLLKIDYFTINLIY